MGPPNRGHRRPNRRRRPDPRYATSEYETAVMVHNYLEERGFENAKRAFARDASSVLSGRDLPRGTRKLVDVVREYVEMKEREARRGNARGLVGKMLDVIDAELLARQDEDDDDDDDDLMRRDRRAATSDDERTDRIVPIVERDALVDTPKRTHVVGAPADFEARVPAVTSTQNRAAGGRRKAAPQRFVPGRGPTANDAPVSATTTNTKRTPVALGTIAPSSVAASPSGTAPRGSLRPFTLPEQIQNESVQQKMADVIVNAFGGRGRLKTSTYGNGASDASGFLEEEAVDQVMHTLLEEDGELGEFLWNMMADIEKEHATTTRDDPNSPPDTAEATRAAVSAAFASPRKSPRTR
jgi:hypothetical protein